MPGGAAEGGAAPGGCLDSWWPPWLPPSPIYFSRTETPEDRTLFHDLASVPPPPRFQDREHQKTSSRHPAEGRNHLRELLHHHGYASRMNREYSTLDHGSMISSYVMFSSHLCSSWIRPRELPYMIEAHM